jgi:hypothetical protein
LSASLRQVWSQRLALLELSFFLTVMWCGKAFYGVGIQSFRILFLLFVSVVVVIVVFFQVWLQESILFGLLKASQAHL